MKKYYKLSLLSVFWIIQGNLFAQNTQFSLSAPPDSLKVYTSLEEALESPEKVYILDLGDQELGKISPKLGLLSNLQTLYLYGNQLSELPIEITTLKNLKKLDLYNNDLSQLPAEFSQFENLVYLDLGENNFKEIPEVVYELPKLHDLYVYGNKIRHISPKITNLKQLHTLRLGRGLRFFSGGNQIRNLPDSFGELENLQELYLPDNCLKTLPESFSQLKRLKWLDLSYNRFREIPPSINSLDSLRYLGLWHRGFASPQIKATQEALKSVNLDFPLDYEGSFWGIVPGFQQGKFSVVELGIVRAFKKDILVLALGAGAEINLQESSQAARVSAWANGLGLFSLGIHGLYYLDNSRNNFAIRPEIGLGISMFSINYGYNILFRKGSENINKHLVSIRTIIPISPFFSIFR